VARLQKKEKQTLLLPILKYISSIIMPS